MAFLRRFHGRFRTASGCVHDISGAVTGRFGAACIRVEEWAFRGGPRAIWRGRQMREWIEGADEVRRTHRITA
jgi:hypothetical protein